MLTKLALNNVPSIDETIWLVCNLSFSPDVGSMALLKSLSNSYPGLNLVHIHSASPEGLINEDDIKGWGQIPLFISRRPNEAANLFFDFILRSKSSLLTLYIHQKETLASDEQLDTSKNIRLGKLITPTDLQGFDDGIELKNYIKSKLSFFEQAHTSYFNLRPDLNNIKFKQKYTWSDIERELIWLNEKGKCLSERGKFKLYLTDFNQLEVIPNEIGRLRALTFDAVGEGTGKAIDLDTYDEYYQQLFLVDMISEKIVGGYRIGACDQILNQYGLQGLYSHALYHIDRSVEPLLNKSIELGRSFIIPSYQKKQIPLFLLWNGILQFLQEQKRYKYILGMVSISRVYSDVSRSLIISYLRKHHYLPALASSFRARQEFHMTSSPSTLDTLVKVFNGDLIRLDEFIAEIEPENYRLPVLIRKYINQNARFIGFNLDPDFSECVDGLMLLDIEEIPASTIQMLREK